MTIQYVAYDGRAFDNKKDCERYEESLSRKGVNRTFFLFDENLQPTFDPSVAMYIKASDEGTEDASDYFDEYDVESPWSQKDCFYFSSGVFAYDIETYKWFDFSKKFESMKKVADLLERIPGGE